MFSLPINTRLFRATKEINQILEPHFCTDTGKTGCYFSYNDPFLADSMVLEYNQPLYRAEFIIKQKIVCFKDKYSCLQLPENMRNINHIDFTIGALTLFDDYNKFYCEVFLIERELKKLELKNIICITPEEIKNEYSEFLVSSSRH